MDADDLIAVFELIAKARGVKKNRFFSRWSVFAYPIWANPEEEKVAFKVLVYRGVDSSRTRAAKMLINHGLSIFVNAVGSQASGLGAIGAGVENSTKFGKLGDAFDVDVGAIQLAEVLESDATPEEISSAILASGKLLLYAIVRVDRGSSGWNLYVRAESRVTSYSQWSVDNVESMEGSATRYLAMKNGVLIEEATILGNYRTGRTA